MGDGKWGMKFWGGCASCRAAMPASSNGERRRSKADKIAVQEDPSKKRGIGLSTRVADYFFCQSRRGQLVRRGEERRGECGADGAIPASVKREERVACGRGGEESGEENEIVEKVAARKSKAKEESRRAKGGARSENCNNRRDRRGIIDIAGSPLFVNSAEAGGGRGEFARTRANSL
jgi:hypothetical protein